MSISIDYETAGSAGVVAAPPERDTTGLLSGHIVPDDAATRALKGVLWSVTLARVVLVPVFLAGALRLQELTLRGADLGTLRWGLLLCLTVIAASDLLDGWIARRYGLASQAGAVADALADKLAQVALVAFFAFGAEPAFAALPVWFFALLVTRDLVLGGGWLVLRIRAVPLSVVHRLHGRAATAGVFGMLLWLTAGIRASGFAALMVVTAALVWVSTGAYVADAWIAARQARERRAESGWRRRSGS